MEKVQERFGGQKEGNGSYLATSVLLLGLLMVQNTIRSGQNEVTELARGQQVVGPLLDLVNSNVEARRDNGSLVQAAEEVNNNLSGTVVIDNFELTNVAWRRRK